MITTIPQTPDNVAAFRATGEITKEDYENCIYPQVKAKINQFQELNFLLLIETEISDFSFGALLDDAALGIKHLTKWNRVAIVTDQVGIKNFTEIFGVLVPGEYETFPIDDLENALFWCANGNEK